MNIILEYIVIIGAMLVVCFASSMTKKGFSMNIFMISLIIAISVLVWKNMLPFYTIIFIALIMIAMLFAEGKEVAIDE